MYISPNQWLLISVAVVCAAVQTCILRILIRNKLRSDFSIFFRYNALCAVANVVTIVPFLYWCPQYFYIFWVLQAVIMVFEFWVVYEALVHALSPYSALIDLGKILFRWAGLFLLMAGLLTALAAHGSESNKIVAAVNLMQRSMRLMQCGLLLLFLLLEKRLGLSWRSYSMSIALGLGVYAAVDLSVSYLAASFAAWSGALSVFGNAVYLAAATFWAVCLAQHEPARRNVMDSPSRLIFQRWNEALTGHGYGQPASASSTVESFLPGIEKTVDRVMSRKALQ
ncbi:MAG TPA: hypothetical protein VI488_20170 [Candidatus Angelobacter sp.]